MAFSIFAVSCKDDEETVTKNYMIGDIVADIPQYAIVGTTVTLNGSGVTYPEDVTYTWLITSMYPDTIPYNPVTITLPDTICSISGTLIATPGADYKADYYSKTTSFNMYILDTTRNESLQGLTLRNGIVDQRDGRFYHTVEIGDLEWFAENLAYAQEGISYFGFDATDAIFGRYYTWEQATGGVDADGLLAGPQGICPDGWRIPTNKDWASLAAQASDNKITTFKDSWDKVGEMASVDAYLNETRMWDYSPDNTHTNSLGFNAIPGGNFQYDGLIFRNDGEYAFWWSATQKNSSQAYYRYIYYDLGNFPFGATDKAKFAASVRCVRAAQKIDQ